MPLTDDVTVRRKVGRQAAASAERREQILDAATAAFTEHGFNGTSLREIATRAGMSHTGVMHHFPDKAAILEGVLDRMLQRATREVELSARHGHHFLQALVALAERDIADPSDLLMYRLIAAEALSPSHPAHGYIKRWYATVRDSAVSALTDLQDRGHYIAADIPITIAATQIAGLRDGLDPQWILDPDVVDLIGAVRAQLAIYTDLPV